VIPAEWRRGPFPPASKTGDEVMSQTVLLVDDDPLILEALKRVLRKEPYGIVTAASAEEAAHLLEEREVDLIVCDEEMPGMSGTEFLARVARERPQVIRIILTGHPSLPAALRAINEGKVYQFVTKPCNEIELAILLRHALGQKALIDKSRALLDVAREQATLIDETRIMRRLRERPASPPSAAIQGHDEPSGEQVLLQEMDEAVRKGRDLLASYRSCRELYAD
jgi:two-component system, probable response regulator PhcQ